MPQIYKDPNAEILARLNSLEDAIHNLSEDVERLEDALLVLTPSTCCTKHNNNDLP